MRILGNCPACGRADAIEVFRRERTRDETQCSHCGRAWENWERLVAEEHTEGHRLIPVDVWQLESFEGALLGVRLARPFRLEVPWAETIVLTLNAALLVRYPRLRVNAACEGGVCGRVGTGYIELINNGEDAIGLSDDLACDREGAFDRETNWVLEFYGRMLRRLFEQPIQIGRSGVRLRPGAIIWLPASGEENQREAERILWFMLQKIGGSRFPSLVFKKLDEIGSLGRRYLRGPTDEEIVRSFVPPPGFDDFVGRRES